MQTNKGSNIDFKQSNQSDDDTFDKICDNRIDFCSSLFLHTI